MQLLGKNITAEDRALVNGFKAQFQVLIDVIDRMLGVGGPNVAVMLAAANRFRPAEF